MTFESRSHIVWEDWGSLVRMAHSTFDGPPALLHRAVPGDVKHVETDGAMLAWIEGYDREPGGSYRRIELWTAPFTAAAEDLSPRLVTALPERGMSNSAEAGTRSTSARRAASRPSA